MIRIAAAYPRIATLIQNVAHCENTTNHGNNAEFMVAQRFAEAYADSAWEELGYVLSDDVILSTSARPGEPFIGKGTTLEQMRRGVSKYTAALKGLRGEAGSESKNHRRTM